MWPQLWCVKIYVIFFLKMRKIINFCFFSKNQMCLLYREFHFYGFFFSLFSSFYTYYRLLLPSQWQCCLQIFWLKKKKCKLIKKKTAADKLYYKNFGATFLVQLIFFLFSYLKPTILSWQLFVFKKLNFYRNLFPTEFEERSSAED